MDIALHIPDFWCGYICGVVSLFVVAVVLGMRKGRHEAEELGRTRPMPATINMPEPKPPDEE